ncbi:MAG TPA: O-antigen ligase domain-containing protein [Gammaproteobacteria bacterium]|nr:O-antigen ligase domain-containing protein [Gammaproteobacteria bacterium]
MNAHLPCADAAGRSAFSHLYALALPGIAALPVCLLLLPDLAEVIYTLVTMAGLACLLHHGLSDDERQRLFLVSFLPLLFFGVAALSVAVSGDYNNWLRPLKKLAELLATPLVAVLVMRANIHPRHFITTAKLSALLLLAAALYQFLVLHSPRPGGAISPFPFAHIALLLGFFSLIHLPLESTRQKLFSLTAFSAGFLTTLISQTRIEWINALILMAALLLVWRRAGLLSKRIMLVIGCTVLALSLLSVSTPFVHKRVSAALDQYQAFQNHQGWHNSVGQRFLMWRHGLEAAAAKPVFGWGIHRSQQAAVAGLSDPQMKKTLGKHHNLHSEYVNTLAAKGAVGLVSLLALLFVPLSVFYTRSANREQLVYTASGVLLCTSYAVSGIAFQAFGDDTMNIFFVIVLSYTLTAVAGEPARARSTHQSLPLPQNSDGSTVICRMRDRFQL